jgi:hypothetical protein
LRVRAKEGIGEVWLLSGLTDEVSFGTSSGDEAMDRMRTATDATYELVGRLPHPGGGFKKRFPSKGSIATATPVTLMRYCEQYALTCRLAVESKNVLVEATYDLGDLVGVETTADDDGITAMLEATEGTYEFTLPRVELPPGTPVLPPAPSLTESLPPPESLAFRALLENKPVIRPLSNEAEVKRKTVEIARQQKAAGPTRSVPRPASASKPDKEEAKPAAKTPAPKEVVIAAKEEEPKPIEPVKAEPVAPPKEEEKPAEPAKAPEEEKKEPPKPEESEPVKVAAKATPPEKRSMTWLIVPLLFAAAIVYLLMTNRL